MKKTLRGWNSTLAPVSRKQAKKNRARTPVRDAYLAAHPMCEAQASPKCKAQRQRATEVHEPWTRARGGPIDDPLNMLSVDRGCHLFIHTHNNASEEHGWLIPAHEGAAWLARRHEEAA